MDDFWLVMRDTFGETLVEGKEMTGCAGIGKSHWGHQFAACRRIVRGQCIFIRRTRV